MKERFFFWRGEAASDRKSEERRGEGGTRRRERAVCVERHGVGERRKKECGSECKCVWLERGKVSGRERTEEGVCVKRERGRKEGRKEGGERERDGDDVGFEGDTQVGV